MKTYHTSCGESIYLATQGATRLARQTGEEVTFTFNEIPLTTTPSSNPDDIAVIYSLKSEIRRLKKP